MSISAQEASGFRDRLLRGCEQHSSPNLGDHAAMATPKEEPVGFVSRSAKEALTKAWNVGICLGEDCHPIRDWVQLHSGGAFSLCSRTPSSIAWPWTPDQQSQDDTRWQQAGFACEGDKREVFFWHIQRLNLVHLQYVGQTVKDTKSDGRARSPASTPAGWRKDLWFRSHRCVRRQRRIVPSQQEAVP